MKDIGACELVKIGHMKETGDAMIRLLSDKPRHTYRPHHTAKSWKGYLEDLSTSPLASFITEDFSPANGDKAALHACRFLKVAADSSSPILTLLVGLESEISDLSSRTELSIHFVGADILEFSGASMTEEVYHLLPELQTLSIGHVGPDVGSTHGNTTQLLDFGCCPECRKMGRSPRQVFLADDLYHNFAKSELFAKYPPDLVVAFNSGHAESEVQRWRPTLKCILDLRVPADFTTYNESEAIGEGKIFDGMGAQFSRRPAENPWRGVLARLGNFAERYDVYYSNCYWYIVKGRTRG